MLTTKDRVASFVHVSPRRREGFKEESRCGDIFSSSGQCTSSTECCTRRDETQARGTFNGDTAENVRRNADDEQKEAELEVQL